MCIPTILAAVSSAFSSVFATTAAASTAAAATGTAAGALASSAAAAGAAASAAGAAGAAGAAATGMSAAQMLQLGLSAGGTLLSTIGSINQAQAAKQIAANNAKVAGYQAEDALRRGEKDAQEARQKAMAYKSSQRAMMGARGLDLTYGTAADIQDQTDFFAEMDADTARLNARKEAWAKRSQQTNFQLESAASRPWLAGATTFLSGANQVADKWYSYTR